MFSAASSRPACSCSVASCISCAKRSPLPDGAWPLAGGTCGAGWLAAGTAPTGIPGMIAALSLPAFTCSVNGITKPLDDRLEDRDRRLHVLQVVAVAIARALVELFGHLGIAGGARIAAVLMKGETPVVELLADEVEHAARRTLLVVDDVLVADRQV